VQTSPMLASGAQLLPCGPMHVTGAKHYQICNTDWCHCNFEESCQYSFRGISAGDA